MIGVTARLTAEQERLVSSSRVVDRVVPVLAGRYRSADKDDLRSEAHESLVRAAMNFRAELGVPFDGYAYRCVYLDLKRSLGDEARRRKRILALAAGAALDTMAAAKDPGDMFNDTLSDAQRHAREFVADAFTAFALRALGSAAPSSDAIDVGERLDRQRRRERLIQALDGLGARARVLHLRYFEEKEWDEVARELGVSNATARREHDAAVKLLAARLVERRVA